MNTTQLLDAVKHRLQIHSDYALAARLGMKRQGIRDLRERGLSDARCVQVAQILEVDPAQVLAWVHAERAQDPAVRKVWEKLAKSIGSAAAAILLALAISISGGIRAANAAYQAISYPVIHYAKFIRSWLLRLLARFRGRRIIERHPLDTANWGTDPESNSRYLEALNEFYDDE